MSEGNWEDYAPEHRADEGMRLADTEPAPDVIRFALAIPTCARWMPERDASLRRLKQSLGFRPQWYKEFDERESNRVWPTKLWRWGVETGASHILQLQDDVVTAPNFWPALRAMVEAQPTRVLGLHSNHPLASVQWKAGRRWYRDRWVTGPAYLFPREKLVEFLDWCAKYPEDVEQYNEDSLISRWATLSKVDVWHPVPAITDHDLGVPSTYGNDAHHEFSMYRRPPVTWRDAPSHMALESVDYWRCTDDSAPLLPGPGTQTCWFCNTREGKITSSSTGARLCAQCVADAVGAALSRLQ